jgi:hypothetical protein
MRIVAAESEPLALQPVLRQTARLHILDLPGFL